MISQLLVTRPRDRETRRIRNAEKDGETERERAAERAERNMCVG